MRRPRRQPPTSRWYFRGATPNSERNHRNHAFYVRSVIGRLAGKEAASFVLEGEDWFALPGVGGLDWPAIRAVLEEQQERLAAVAAGIEAGRIRSPLSEAERFDLALGITCHAIYHAGQVQLIKVLGAA